MALDRRVTYSVYLLHMTILISFRLTGWIPPLWLFLGCVIAAALLCHRAFEMPAQQWVRAWGHARLR